MIGFKGPVLAIMLRAPLLIFLVFTGARVALLLKSSVLAANKTLRIFNITKMAAKTSQRAMFNRQYRVFKITNEFVFPRFTSENIEDHFLSGGEAGMVIVSRHVT